MSPRKKPKNSWKRIASILSFFGSFGFVVVGTIVLVAIGSGYSYDFRNHRTTLNGLVVIGSYPTGATILQNGKNIHRKTPFRNTVEAQSYNYTVTKDGYQPWQKQIQVKASEVVWVQYIWLLPSQLRTSTLLSQPTMSGLVPSKDHKLFAYSVASGNDAGLWVLDTTSHQPTRVYTPKAAVVKTAINPEVVETPAEVLAEVSWADDNSHLLLHSTIGPRNNYQIIPTTPGAAIALSETFRYEFNSSLRFSPSNWRELYWVSPEGLRKIDLNAQTVSAVLAESVTSFAFGADRILYVQSSKLGKTLYSIDHSGKDKKELVQALADSDSYEIAFSNYKNQDVLAVLPTKARTVTLYSDLSSGFPLAKIVSKDALHLAFTADGHFLSHYSENGVGVYDLEKSSSYAFDSRTGVTGLSWFDNAHLLTTRNGELFWSEFDGANTRDLAKTTGLGYSTADQKAILLPMLGADLKTTDLISIETKH